MVERDLVFVVLNQVIDMFELENCRCKFYVIFVEKINFVCYQSVFVVLCEFKIENLSEEVEFLDIKVILELFLVFFKGKIWIIDKIV